MAKKLYGTDPDQVPTNADLGTIAYQDSANVHLTGRVVVSAVNPAPFTVPNASESLEINDGSTTKLLMYADNSNAYIQASKYDGTNPGRTLIFATKQGTDGIAAESARFNVNGNLAFPDGQGIDFSASAGSEQTSSLLDDYEEGTFAPTVTGSATAGTTTYSSRNGYYTKIGRLVNINCIVNWSSMTGSGFMELKGIPYPIANLSPGSQNYPVGAALPSNINWTGGTMLVGLGLGGSSIIALYGSSDNGGATRQNCVNESANFRLTMSYMTT